jgi:hypothetical protein
MQTYFKLPAFPDNGLYINPATTYHLFVNAHHKMSRVKQSGKSKYFYLDSANAEWNNFKAKSTSEIEDKIAQMKNWLPRTIQIVPQIVTLPLTSDRYSG